MLVKEGRFALLDNEKGYYSTFFAMLITTDLAVDPDVGYSDLVAAEAAWSGYARHALTTWETPTIGDPGPSTMLASGPATFLNSSGSDVTFYGVGIVDSGLGFAIHYLNIGLQTIPAGMSFSFNFRATNDDDPSA